jgi:hypothetical protein
VTYYETRVSYFLDSKTQLNVNSHWFRQLLEEIKNLHIDVRSKHKTCMTSQVLQCEKQTGRCNLQMWIQTECGKLWKKAEL